MIEVLVRFCRVTYIVSWPEFAFAPLVGRVIMQQVRTVRRCGILAWLPPAHLLSSLIVTANTKANLDTNTNLHANTKVNANTHKEHRIVKFQSMLSSREISGQL